MRTRAGKLTFVAVVMMVVGVASCGGKSYNGAQSSGSSSPTTQSSPDAQPYIAAATTGLKTGDFASAITDTQAHCLAAGLVNTLGVQRLKNAGVTPSDLSDSSKDLPSSIAASTPDSVKHQLGAAMQACGFGALLGPALAATTGDSGLTINEKAKKCLADGLDNPNMSGVLADAVLSKTPSGSDADSFAAVILQCLDLAPVFAKQFGVTFSAAEASCINQMAKSSDAMKRAVAAGMTGGSSSTSSADNAALGQALLTCLTPQHRAAIEQQGG